METAKAHIINMTNQEDADKIMAALETVWGLSRVEVNVKQGEAIFTFDERMASLEDFKQAIIDLGYSISNEMNQEALNENL